MLTAGVFTAGCVGAPGAATLEAESSVSDGSGVGAQYALKWRASSYVSAVTSALAGLRTQGLLVDVTLSCEGKHVRAHRVLLAACSPYFRAVFRDNPCAHPVIIFRNVRHEDLVAVVHFMYHGEVSVPHERLASFLNTAELLQVTGLTDSPEDESSSSANPTNVPVPAEPIRVVEAEDRTEAKRRKVATRRDELDFEPLLEPAAEDSRANTAPFRAESKADLVEVVENTDIILEQSRSAERSASSFPDDMDICDSEAFQTANILNNLKGAEGSNSQTEPPQELPIDGTTRETTQDGDLVKFRCQLCWKGFKHPTSLTLHKDSHTGKTQCPVCHRSFSRSYDMRSHLMKIHQDQPMSDVKSKVAKSSLGNNT